MPGWDIIRGFPPVIVTGGFFTLVVVFCGRSAEDRDRFKDLTPIQRKVAPLAILLLLATVLSAVRGVNHTNMLGFAEWTTAALGVPLALANGILLFLIRPLSEWRSNLAVPVFGAAAFMAFLFLRPTISRVGEWWDFNRAGVAELRREAAACVANPDAYVDAASYGSSGMARKTLPPTLSRMLGKYDGCYLRPFGVFWYTDGWVNHKGGYLIIPEGSEFVPPHSGRICDGIYRVNP